LRRAEDGDFTHRRAVAGYWIGDIPEPLARIRRQGQERLTKRSWLMLFAFIHLWWRHRALYYRVYGVRGIVSSLLESLEMGTNRARYVNGAIRLLIRFIPVKRKIRPDYEEPVQGKVSPVTMSEPHC